VLGALLLAALAGCAALKTTPAQDFAREAWDSCPKTANISLEYIEPSGRIHYRVMNSPVGMRDVEACINAYYAAQRRPATASRATPTITPVVETVTLESESTDPQYRDYLGDVRRRIEEKLAFPCAATPSCEYKATFLLVEFGIANDGSVRFVNVVQTSGRPTDDAAAVTAVKLAAPFPPIPAAASPSTVPVRATFHYIVGAGR